MLAACGGSQPPTGASDTIPQSRAIAAHDERGGSWMLPEANSSDLVYTSDGSWVFVYAYPSGELVGTLGGFQESEGLCSDKNGNVFIADVGTQEVVEYAHGGDAPIATLNDSGNYPNGCAVDPSTGNLAVAGGLLGHRANVAIYRAASGTPTIYPDDEDSMLAWCTYDSASNLFIDPWDQYGGSIVELPYGSGSLKYITVNHQINPGGAIQWDGDHLVLGNPSEKGHGPSTLYQLAISGSSASVIKTLTLYFGKGRDQNPRIGNQFWIFGRNILDTNHREIATWRYPHGGYPTSRFIKYGGFGLTISRVPSH